MEGENNMQRLMTSKTVIIRSIITLSILIALISLGTYFFSDQFDEYYYYKKNEIVFNQLATQFLKQQHIVSIVASDNLFTNGRELHVHLDHSYLDEIQNDPQNEMSINLKKNKSNRYDDQLRSDQTIQSFSKHFNIPVAEIEYWLNQIQRRGLYGISKPKGTKGLVVIIIKDNSHRFIYSKDPNVDMYIEAIRINRNWWYCSIYCD